MKNFLSTFAICFVLCGIFLFFGGFLILSNLWLTVALAALVISLLICAFLSLEGKIEEVEGRLRALEQTWEQPSKDDC